MRQAGVWERVLIEAALDRIPRDHVHKLLPTVTDADINQIAAHWGNGDRMSAWKLAEELVTAWKATRNHQPKERTR